MPSMESQVDTQESLKQRYLDKHMHQQSRKNSVRTLAKAGSTKNHSEMTASHHDEHHYQAYHYIQELLCC